jgi:fucose permease
MKLQEAPADLTLGGKTNFFSLRRVQIGLIFAGYLFVGLNSGGFGVILPDLSASYGLDKSATGLLFLASAGGYVTAAFVSGWLSQRLGLRYFVVAGLGLFGLGSLMIAFQAPFGLILLARLLLGLAMAVLETGGNFYVTALPNNTALLNYLHAFFGVGALLGPAVAASILGWGWPSLFWIWFGLSGLLVVGFYLGFRRLPPSVRFTSAHPKTPGLNNLMLQTMRLPLVWWAILFLLFYVGGESSVGSWTFTFLSEEEHQVTALAGALVSVYWLGLTLGRLAMGWATSRLHLADRELLLGCVLGSLAGLGLFWLWPDQPVVAGLGLLLTGFSFGPIYPTTLALLSRLAPSHLVPSLIALMTSLSILGIAVFPWLAGVLFDLAGLGAFAPYVIGLSLAMLASGAVLLRPKSTR